MPIAALDRKHRVIPSAPPPEVATLARRAGRAVLSLAGYWVVTAAAAASVSAQAPRSTAPGTAATWRLVEELRYDPDGAAELGRPGLLVVARSGDVYLGDGSNQRIIVFDSRGRYSRAIGRQGQGPGEFVMPGRLGWLGDTLWVTDQQLGRVTFFGPDGRVLRTATERMSVPGLGSGAPTAVLPGGAVYGVPSVGSSTRFNLDSVPVLYHGPGESTWRAVARVSYRNFWGFVGTGSGASAMGIAFFQPLGRAPFVEPLPDGRGLLVVTMPEARAGTEGRVTITSFGRKGSIEWQREWTYAAEPVTSAQFDSVARERQSQFKPPGRSEPMFSLETIRDSLYRAPTWAPFTSAFVGADGRLWLRERPRSPGQRFRLFGADGAPVGVVEALPGVTVRYATATHAWGFIEVDDVPVLVRYRLEPGARGGATRGPR